MFKFLKLIDSYQPPAGDDVAPISLNNLAFNQLKISDEKKEEEDRPPWEPKSDDVKDILTVLEDAKQKQDDPEYEWTDEDNINLESYYTTIIDQLYAVKIKEDDEAFNK